MLHGQFVTLIVQTVLPIFTLRGPRIGFTTSSELAFRLKAIHVDEDGGPRYCRRQYDDKWCTTRLMVRFAHNHLVIRGT
jgi:hypothetical protein